MRGLKQLFWVDLKLYFREPVSAFFTLAFPPLMVVLFGAIYGNEPDALFDGRGAMDISMPAYTGLVIASMGLLGLPIATAAYRERGVLKRFRATPLKPTTYIASDVLANLVMTTLGMIGAGGGRMGAVSGPLRGSTTGCGRCVHSERSGDVRCRLPDCWFGTRGSISTDRRHGDSLSHDLLVGSNRAA